MTYFLNSPASSENLYNIPRHKYVTAGKNGMLRPLISVILPTYNRADTIIRAINSVLTQSFKEWELVVVDDGSTDDTADRLAGIDPRIRVITQENRGMTEARNTAIRASHGEYIAFLDSDDEFMPHHLELCAAFLDAHPEAQFISSELLEDFGPGGVVNHYRVETSSWYPQKAKMIGSRCFDLPAGETDDYLRAYTTRQPIGDWGLDIIKRVAPAQQPFHYTGTIFKHMRFDYLIAITASVIRRSAIDALGLPEARWRTGSDYHYLARLCAAYPANFLSIPTFVKHEFAMDNQLPQHGHIVTGKSAVRFIKDFHAAWEDLFWSENCADKDTRGIRSLRLYWMAKIAMAHGERELALDWLQQAHKGLPYFWRAIGFYWLAKLTSGEVGVKLAYAVFLKVHNGMMKLREHALMPIAQKVTALIAIFTGTDIDPS
jgi:glycosyltransferase involved in cell wall biosynthesis